MTDYNYDHNGNLLPQEYRGKLKTSQSSQYQNPTSNYPLPQSTNTNYPVQSQQQPQSQQPQQQMGYPQQQAGYPMPQQPPVILVGSTTTQCRFCGSPVPPITTRVTSGLGWAIFGIMLVSCIGTPLCWLGLLMKREKRVCSTCRRRLL